MAGKQRAGVAEPAGRGGEAGGADRAAGQDARHQNPCQRPPHLSPSQEDKPETHARDW